MLNAKKLEVNRLRNLLMQQWKEYRKKKCEKEQVE